jgi:hypothetical protein
MTDYSSDAKWSEWGGVPYSAFRSGGLDTAYSSAKGFSLDYLKAYASNLMPFTVDKDTDIWTYGNDSKNSNPYGYPSDISIYDDEPRYFYPNLLLGNEDFEADKIEVPLVFSVKDKSENFNTLESKPADISALKSYFSGLGSSADSSSALRNIQGQTASEVNSVKSGTLGDEADDKKYLNASKSNKNITMIVFKPVYYDISGSGFTTGDGFAKAAYGETVTLSLTGKKADSVFLSVKSGATSIPSTYNASTGKFSFKMPKGAVSVSVSDKIDIKGATIAAEKYTGKTIKSGLVVNYSGKTLKEGVDYKITSAGANKSIGKASVTLAGIGNYKGSYGFKFNIIPTTAKVTKSTVAKKSAKVTIKKVSAKQKVTKYQISYRVKGKAKWKTVTAKTPTHTLKDLTKGKKYEVRVRAVKTIKSGASKGTYCGAWSATHTTKKII